MTGFAREHAEINPDLLEGIDVLAAGIGPEYQVRIRCAVQPSVMLDLVLELPRRPAGIAQRQDGAARPRSASDRLENIECRSEADAFVDRQRRIFDEKVTGMQHTAALGIHRT